MPLARYFVLVGGALLALLLIVNACLPAMPVAGPASSNAVVIRIHSTEKLPERVVYDTSVPTVVVEPTAATESKPPEPVVQVADVPAKAREAFAQLQPSDAAQLRPSHAAKREARPHYQHKTAKMRRAPYEYQVAQPAYYGWFGDRFW